MSLLQDEGMGELALPFSSCAANMDEEKDIPSPLASHHLWQEIWLWGQESRKTGLTSHQWHSPAAILGLAGPGQQS